MEIVEQIEEPLILGTVIAPDDYIGDMIALFLVSYIYTSLYYILPLYNSKIVGCLKSGSLESCLYSVSVLIVITKCIYEKKLIEQFRFIIGAPENWLLKVFRSMLLWNFRKMPKTEIYSNLIERLKSQF